MVTQMTGRVRNGQGPIPQDLLRIFVSGERNKKSKRCTDRVAVGDPVRRQKKYTVKPFFK